jgi:hypothetical protein
LETRDMPQQQFRVFLSAVTSEFGKARDAIGADLRSRDTLVRVQSDFRQEWGSDTTLKKLHDYIRECSAVVCVIGKRSGAVPPPAAAAPFNDMLPPGIAAASCTQWEFFFARHFKRRLSIYIATNDHAPESDPDGEDDPELQTAFIAHIVDQQGLDRSNFSNKGDLRAAVLRGDWPKKPERKPIVLPYLSLGNLFKGREAFIADLHNSLNRRAGRMAITASVIYGLGGTGKTRAAVEYALVHQEDYSALLFVVAETPEALRRNLAALVGPDALNLPEQNAAEEPVRPRAVLDWLGEHPGCLLIVDNVDTPEALMEAERLLSTLGGGHVIITSRLGNFGGHSIRLNSMSSGWRQPSPSSCSAPTNSDRKCLTMRRRLSNSPLTLANLPSRSNRPAPTLRSSGLPSIAIGSSGRRTGRGSPAGRTQRLRNIRAPSQ